MFGPSLFSALVWGLLFAGKGLFIPFVTGGSLLLAAGIVSAVSVSAASGGVIVWMLAVGVGIAAFLGDQLGFLLGRHYWHPYLDRRSSGWVQRSIRRAEKFSTDLGWWAVVVGRFIPWGRVREPPIAEIVSWRRNGAFA